MKRQFFKISSLVIMLLFFITSNAYAVDFKYIRDLTTLNSETILKYENLSKKDRALVDDVKKYVVIDGAKVAKIVNEYDDNTFLVAVREALNIYYEKMTVYEQELCDFLENVDDRANEMVNNYWMAYEERLNSDMLGYDAESVLVSFEINTDDSLIEDISNDIFSGYKVIFDGKIDENTKLPQYKRDRLQKAYENQYDKVFEIELNLDQTTTMARECLDNFNCFKSVSKNFTTKVDLDVNDTYASQQGYLDALNVDDAWAVWEHTPIVQIWVAVVDTGLDVHHNDLQGSFHEDYSVDIINNNTKLISSSTPYVSSHGTKVAGVISAQTNNSKGIASVCGNDEVRDYVKVMALKVFENNETTTIENTIKAIYYAIENGAEVINLSLGGAGYASVYQEAINIATNDAGITVVAAAGNKNTDSAYYPADYDNVVSVVGVDGNNNKIEVSNFGISKDICAPGNIACTTSTNSTYGSAYGTSIAAPFVSATVAMMRTVMISDPDLALRILIRTATDLGVEGKDEIFANGLLNVGLALEYTKYRKFKNIVFEWSSIEALSESVLKLKWKYPISQSHFEPDGFYIYRSTSKDGTYSKIGTITTYETGTQYGSYMFYSYKDRNLTSNKRYYYKVKGFVYYNNSKKFSPTLKAKSGVTDAS